VKSIVTAENHVIAGGLASAVADALTDAGLSVRLKRVGIADTFCESGSIPYLVKRYHLDAESIAEAARAVLRAAP
jgi:transketolase